MIKLEDMDEATRKECEEWERMYKEPLHLIERMENRNIYANSVEMLHKYAIPRVPDNFAKAIEDGDNARHKAGITYDISKYKFDIMQGRGNCDKPDARLFIGIPYKLGGLGFDGCDCMGLACMFYASNGWHLPKQKESWEGTKGVFRYVRKYYKRIEKEDLQYGDLIIHEQHVDIFLGWSPYNKNDYVLLNQSVYSAEGCTSSRIIQIGDTEYMTTFNSNCEYFHRDESKDEPTSKYCINVDDMEVIKINLLENPYEGRDPFFFALYRGYDLEEADKMARDAENKMTMVDGRINGVIERLVTHNTEKLYKELKRIQDEFNKRAIEEGSPTVELV